MRRNPQRLAWIILLSAFFLCCLTAVACPLSVRWYLINARVEQKALLRSQRGTVRVEQGGRKPLAISVDDPSPTQIYKGNVISTGDLDEGLLTLQQTDRERPQVFASILVYPDTTLELLDVYSPRFGLATDLHTSVLHLEKGSVRVEVSGAIEKRLTRVRIKLLDGEVELTAGSYSLEATNGQVALSVRSGQAVLRDGEGQVISLTDEQRAILSAQGGIEGPLSGERNLIVDGDFSRPDSDWVFLLDEQAQPPGTVDAVTVDGQSAIHFVREGIGPSEVGVFLPLNQNVSGLSSLVLHLKLKITYQSLSVCGTLGSECPVMVRIDYEDVKGRAHQLVHGFYTYDDPNINDDPPLCIVCPPEPLTSSHDQVPVDTWILYDSPNLMGVEPADMRPAVINAIHIYASGHSYDSLVTDVALLAQD